MTPDSKRFSTFLTLLTKVSSKRFQRAAYYQPSSFFELVLLLFIRHFRNERGIGAEIRPAIVSGIATGDALVSYSSVFSLVPSNSPSSLCGS